MRPNLCGRETKGVAVVGLETIAHSSDFHMYIIFKLHMTHD